MLSAEMLQNTAARPVGTSLSRTASSRSCLRFQVVSLHLSGCGPGRSWYRNASSATARAGDALGPRPGARGRCRARKLAGGGRQGQHSRRVRWYDVRLCQHTGDNYRHPSLKQSRGRLVDIGGQCVAVRAFARNRSYEMLQVAGRHAGRAHFELDSSAYKQLVHSRTPCAERRMSESSPRPRNASQGVGVGPTGL